MSRRWFVVSGCSGGGKSTLLVELARRGFATVPEPGRRIVMHEQKVGGDALPWRDPAAFADRLVRVAEADLRAAEALPEPVFFDRGLIDAFAARVRLGGPAVMEALGGARPYDRRVFLAPPWQEIYIQDAERRHELADARAEYDDLAMLYPTLGYTVYRLPLVDVAARADFVQDAVA